MSPTIQMVNHTSGEKPYSPNLNLKPANAEIQASKFSNRKSDSQPRCIKPET